MAAACLARSRINLVVTSDELQRPSLWLASFYGRNGFVLCFLVDPYNHYYRIVPVKLSPDAK